MTVRKLSISAVTVAGALSRLGFMPLGRLRGLTVGL